MTILEVAMPHDLAKSIQYKIIHVTKHWIMEHTRHEKHCKTLTCVNLNFNSSSFLLFMVDISLKIIKNVFKIKECV